MVIEPIIIIEVTHESKNTLYTVDKVDISRDKDVIAEINN